MPLRTITTLVRRLAGDENPTGAGYENEEDDPDTPRETQAEMARWEICPDCEGEGKHVHDALSVPSEEYRDDPDFMEDYFSGAYDVRCERCDGTGKVRTDSDPGGQRARERCGRLVNEDGELLEGSAWGA